MSKSLSAGHHDVTNFKFLNVTIIKFMVREKGRHYVSSGFLKNRKSAVCERFMNAEEEVGTAGKSGQAHHLKKFYTAFRLTAAVLPFFPSSSSYETC